MHRSERIQAGRKVGRKSLGVLGQQQACSAQGRDLSEANGIRFSTDHREVQTTSTRQEFLGSPTVSKQHYN